MRSDFFQVNGIRLHVRTAGPEDGPLLVLLHGFPQDSESWSDLTGYFVSAGFRVLAPDQRGYGLSDQPTGKDSYRLDVLAADIIALIESAGRKAAFILGHDWGAAVTWWLASRFPAHVIRAGVVGAPHPEVLVRALHRSPMQALRSIYMRLFNIPVVPEMLLGAGNSALIHALSGWLGYRPSSTTSRSIGSMLNWYRALMLMKVTEPRPVPVPVLMAFGRKDPFFTRPVVLQSLRLCERGRLEWIEGENHWVLNDRPRKMAELYLDFFQSASH